MPNIYSVNVENGAQWLDIVSPGWELQVDLKLLDMAKPSVCIAGQLFGLKNQDMRWLLGQKEGLGCATGYDILGRVVAASFGEPWTAFARSGRSIGWMVSHGFSFWNGTGLAEDWKLLDEAWGELIKDRFDRGLIFSH
ncbi:MAG TPA: hypothetical protein VJ742_12865 [Nitrososphaera sp.]|nr:hypothetical protein [Nitrososphaera sp.]